MTSVDFSRSWAKAGLNFDEQVSASEASDVQVDGSTRWG
jgi:hypothetical protein